MNLSIARRLQLMIAAAVLALVVVGYAGYHGIRGVSESILVYQNEIVPSVMKLEKIEGEIIRARLRVLRMVTDAEHGGLEERFKGWQGNRQLIIRLIAEYEKSLAVNETDRRLISVVKQSVDTYLQGLDKVVAHIVKTQDRNAYRMVDALGGERKVMEKALNDIMVFNLEEMEQETARSKQVMRQALIWSLSMNIAGIAAIVLMGVLLIRGISRSLAQMAATLQAAESNLDFTVRADTKRQDELGQMAGVINRLLTRLQESLKTLAQDALQVASSANEMATASSQVAQASKQQSDAASGMAATVEEMTVSINHVGDRAQEANRLSCESGQLAVSGEQVIGQTVQGINQIATTVHEAAAQIEQLEQHSAQISSVVAVIKEVADQTNLLALNAAIEAARAGEQGRGFAVVADEVRKLAERTASSTKEIAQTIETIRHSAGAAVAVMQSAVAEVGHGVERAREASESIHQIGEGSRHAVGMVEEITSAIREQAAATNNIAVQVEKIAQMSEESSAAAAESARTASDLDRLANEMRQVVAAYRL